MSVRRKLSAPRVVLTECRQTLDLTCEELGSLVGLSETSIRNLEKGRNVTSVEIMLKLADLFGKGPLQLFPDSEL
uniref:helix-turn-helix transcriptional regulator n=1 Tax=Gorillibacterium sp. sgz5001074 TaxID=3446695 RepID=UPI003F674890